MKRGLFYFFGEECWKAKDYFKGLDVGRYLIHDQQIGKELFNFAGGDYMRFWALLPAETRRARQLALKKRIEGTKRDG